MLVPFGLPQTSLILGPPNSILGPKLPIVLPYAQSSRLLLFQHVSADNRKSSWCDVPKQDSAYEYS